MLANYFTAAFRNLTKNPVFAAINVIGLSLGMAAFILIFQYITFEKSVNGFHSNLPNLYRVLMESPSDGKRVTFEFVSPTVGPVAKDEFGEVAGYCRIFNQGGIVSYKDESSSDAEKVFREENSFYADASFFTMFSFPLVYGDTKELKQPGTIALSETYSKKYFGSGDPINKVMLLDNQFGRTLYKVVAVYRDMPLNSDIHADLIFSLQTLANPANLNGNRWASLDNIDGQFLFTFLMTREGTNHLELEVKLTEAKKKVRPNAEDIIRLQPVKNMHIAESFSDYYTTFGNLAFLYILEGIALLILVIAWFNYVNLSTAGALKRAKEVGIRKVVGASQKQLIAQFLGESVFLNVVSFIIALVLVGLLQTLYNQLIDKNLSLRVFQENGQWLLGFLIIMVGSFASGAYSAFALSSFDPAQTLKGVFSKSVKGVLMRKTLVVFQFSISVFLIASTLILYQQLDFMKNSNLGVTLEQAVVMTEPVLNQDSTFRQRSKSFLNELSQQSFVKDFSMSGTVPGMWYNYSTPGYIRLNPSPGDEKIVYAITFIDDHYLSVFGIELAAGKNFTPEICGSTRSDNNKIIVNESAAIKFGFDPAEAVGQKITTDERKKEFEIIGVVKDYHHLSLRQSIDPTIFFPSYNPHYFTVKISSDRAHASIDALEELYKKNFPGNPFEYFFADEKYNKQFQSEQQYGLIFSIASGLAIFIACLGLFGLSTFMVKQRMKEVGIRKVLGASVPQITSLLSKDFLILVYISIAIATPIAWYSMHRWLQDFAYRVDIHWWIFVVAGLAAIIIAVITVGYQSTKAASGNPVESLRSE
ncbi:ABC transporter permease [soil metagenome]